MVKSLSTKEGIVKVEKGSVKEKIKELQRPWFLESRVDPGFEDLPVPSTRI
jgi:hypothetical protein